ncbi:MAG: antirestriction protein ArdA [Lachnospiraceae bacterium]|nr:antirestriction protein ArdA [Lachnospiraceae bacterium]
MDNIRVYIVNLRKYNENEPTGAWFSLPVDFEEVKEKLGLDAEHEEYAIHDYDNWPLSRTPEYASLDELNHAADLIDALDDKYIDILSELVSYYGSLEEACESCEDDVEFYNGCDTMADVACEYASENGLLDGVPENLRDYFDYDKYGNDLEAEWYCIKTSDGYACIIG